MGYDVTIFASAFSHGLRSKTRLLQGGSWALEQVKGVKFIWLPSFPYRSNNWRRVVNMLDYTWRAYWLGRRLPRLVPQVPVPDIVLGCSVHLFAVLAGYHLSRRYRSHFFMEVRDLWPQTFLDMGLWREGQLQVRIFRWLEQFLYARAERIVTLSPLTREYLARYSPEWAAKTVLVPNGTKVARFKSIQAVQASGARPLRVMFLGSVGFKNGVDLIIEAMRIVEQTAPGLMECVLVGEGPEKTHLQQMVQDWRLESVQFKGAIPRQQVPECLAHADILVLVERQVLYGSSNKLFDYMAAGKPIVASVFAEHNNLVKEAQCGLSASPEDPADLAEKLLAVARMHAGERSAMGERGRAYVAQHYDYAALAKRLAEALREVGVGYETAEGSVS
jgi:glycosyltransferase involved in cell wall biosynthesis